MVSISVRPISFGYFLKMSPAQAGTIDVREVFEKNHRCSNILKVLERNELRRNAVQLRDKHLAGQLPLYDL
jgi:hypothetical protein